MKIFLDTADVPTIIKHFDTGLIDGITTNPTLIMKSGRNPEDVYRELVGYGIPDISMEIVTEEVDVFVSEGKRLKEQFGEFTTIKVPCTPAGLKACKLLSDEGIRVNVTLIFSAAQAILAARAGAAYISPFVGRVEDNSFDGVALIKEIAAIYRKQYITKTQVLAASLRDVHHVSRCFLYGASVATLPTAIFDKMYNHVLTDAGLAIFEKDFEAMK